MAIHRGGNEYTKVFRDGNELSKIIRGGNEYFSAVLSYPLGYWAELVRSSSSAGLNLDANGNNFWLRTSDGEPLEQQIALDNGFGTGAAIWADQAGDLNEPDFVGFINQNRWYRSRKTGLPWIPADAGIRVLAALPWVGPVYRYYWNRDVTQPLHTFLMTVGQSGGAAGASRGYNQPAGFGAIQAGSTATYTTPLPGHKSVTVIHCRRVNGNINFALSGAANAAADFPTRIVATKTTGGQVVRSFTPTGGRRSVSGGIRQDYAPEAGSPTDVFINNQTVKVDLFYA